MYQLFQIIINFSSWLRKIKKHFQLNYCKLSHNIILNNYDFFTILNIVKVYLLFSELLTASQIPSIFYNHIYSCILLASLYYEKYVIFIVNIPTKWKIICNDISNKKLVIFVHGHNQHIIGKLQKYMKTKKNLMF